MKTFETDTKVGPGGVLTLEQLPFTDGQPVHVRVEVKSDDATASQPRVLGLHQGSVWMSDDFDQPLPDSFWLKDEPSDEASA